MKIKQISNGWMVKIDEMEKAFTYENDEDEIEAMRELLVNIKEYYGVFYSKHNKKNLVIEVEETK